MTAFNPEQFEQTAIDGANQETFINVSDGDYPAYIESTEFRELQDSSPEQPRVVADITWVIPDDDLAEELGLDEIKVRQGIFLDLEPQTFAIQFGTNKNVNLGRLRAALDLNDPGTPFSWSDLIGKAATITVVQEAARNDPTQMYSRVRGISKTE